MGPLAAGGGVAVVLPAGIGYRGPPPAGACRGGGWGPTWAADVSGAAIRRVVRVLWYFGASVRRRSRLRAVAVFIFL